MNPVFDLDFVFYIKLFSFTEISLCAKTMFSLNTDQHIAWLLLQRLCFGDIR